MCALLISAFRGWIIGGTPLASARVRGRTRDRPYLAQIRNRIRIQIHFIMGISEQLFH